MPPITGMRTSVITHAASLNRGDARKSSADTNVHTVYPRDLKRLSVATRIDASSSTMAISVRSDFGRLLTWAHDSADPGNRGVIGVSVRLYFSLEAAGLAVIESERIG